MAYQSTFSHPDFEPKLLLKDNIKVTIHKDGHFTYKMVGTSIQELIWEFIYRQVTFSGNKTKAEWQLTLEEIK